MKFAAAALAIAAGAAPAQPSLEIQTFTPECGETHCKLKKEDWVGVLIFQRYMLETTRAQAAEIERLRKASCTGISS